MSLCRPVIIDLKECLFFFTQSQGKDIQLSYNPLWQKIYLFPCQTFTELWTFEGSDFTMNLVPTLSPSFSELKVLSPIYSWLKLEPLGYQVKPTSTTPTLSPLPALYFWSLSTSLVFNFLFVFYSWRSVLLSYRFWFTFFFFGFLDVL